VGGAGRRNQPMRKGISVILDARLCTAAYPLRPNNGPSSRQMGPLFENGFFLLKPMARGHPLPRPGTLPPPIGDRFQQVVEDVEPYY
jgi:hypothetical protein